jgi:hypothetical protein
MTRRWRSNFERSKRSPAARASSSARLPAVLSFPGHGILNMGSLPAPRNVRSHAVESPPWIMCSKKKAAVVLGLASWGILSSAARHSHHLASSSPFARKARRRISFQGAFAGSGGKLPRLPGLLVRPSLRGRPLPLDVLALGMERAAGHQRGDGEGNETEAHHSSLQVFLRRKAFEV